VYDGTVTELCPEKLNLFKMISFAPNTVARQIENMGNNIVGRQKNNWNIICMVFNTNRVARSIIKY
jgi:hypothetical protein